MMKQEEKVKYLKEYYKKNPIKFIEDFVIIPTPGKSNIIKLYEPQKNVIKEFFDKKYLIMLKSRQIGMSTLCQALITYIFCFYKNCVVGVLSRDGSESSDFCRKTQVMLEAIPSFIRPKFTNKNVRYFSMSNGCKLYSTAISPSNPSSVFRSKSITLLIIDEAAFIKYIDDAWSGISMTLSKTHKDAESNGVPYGIIILSTPNKVYGVGEWFYKMWVDSLNKETVFTPIKIHWSEIEEFRNDPEWYEKQKKVLSPEELEQELELKFISSKNVLFDEKIQIYLQEDKKYYKIDLPFPVDGELWKFSENDIDKDRFYIIGIDVSSSYGKDYTAIQVIDFETSEQVLEFKGKIDPKKLLRLLAYVVTLVPKCCILIENTGGFGHAIIYDCLEDDVLYERLFYELKDDEPVYGISTNVKTRPLIIESLYLTVKNNPNIIKSRRVCEEMLTLEEKRGKVQAESGFNDDLVMALGLCYYAKQYKTECLLKNFFYMKGYDYKKLEETALLNYIHNLNYDVDTKIIKRIEDDKEPDMDLDKDVHQTIIKMYKTGELDKINNIIIE